jgi:hypothetical protein
MNSIDKRIAIEGIAASIVARSQSESNHLEIVYQGPHSNWEELL